MRVVGGCGGSSDSVLVSWRAPGITGICSNASGVWARSGLAASAAAVARVVIGMRDMGFVEPR
jgi:hypothetical protein